ncbi:MAG TPA: flagellar protein FliT [Paucimonas sp.]|nr:flagellar protein FliT [Paucimonas sp.]
MTMTAPELLRHYEAMLLASQQMLDAARSGDWDRLVELERIRSDIEKHLMTEERPDWSGKDAARKSELIQAILGSDDETRMLTAHGMDEMRKFLADINTGKKMKQAYEGS